MNYRICISENPIPASRPRVSRWSTYYTEPYNSYKERIRSLVSDSIPKYKSPLFQRYEPLCVEVVFYMQMPKLSKKRTEEIDGKFHVKKPDLDNCLKAIKDAMNGLVYHDDGQVSMVAMKKVYSFKPRTEISVYKLDEKIIWM